MFRSTPRLALQHALKRSAPPMHSKPLYSSVLDANMYLPDWEGIHEIEYNSTPKVDKSAPKENDSKSQTVVVDFKRTTWVERLPEFLKPKAGTTWYESTHIAAADNAAKLPLTSSMMTNLSFVQRVLYGTPEHVMLSSTTAITTQTEVQGQGFWHRLLYGIPEAELDGGLDATTVKATVTSTKTMTTTTAVLEDDGTEVEVDKTVKAEKVISKVKEVQGVC